MRLGGAVAICGALGTIACSAASPPPQAFARTPTFCACRLEPDVAMATPSHDLLGRHVSERDWDRLDEAYGPKIQRIIVDHWKVAELSSIVKKVTKRIHFDTQVEGEAFALP